MYFTFYALEDNKFSTCVQNLLYTDNEPIIYI